MQCRIPVDAVSVHDARQTCLLVGNNRNDDLAEPICFRLKKLGGIQNRGANLVAFELIHLGFDGGHDIAVGDFVELFEKRGVRKNDFSELLALYAAEKIWDVLTQYPESFSFEHREQLLYASCAAGAAISITGTGFPHPLGYSLTMLDGIPHGKACAVFAGAYLDYNEKTEKGRERIAVLYERLNVKPKVMREFLASLAGVELSFTEEEIAHRVELIKGAKNYTNSPYILSVDEMYDIYRTLFLKRKR